MRDFNQLQTSAQVLRLSEIALVPVRLSSRKRRSAIALILRVAPKHRERLVGTETQENKIDNDSGKTTTGSNGSGGGGGEQARLQTMPSHAQLVTRLLPLSQEQWVKDASLEVLFLQRARNPKDRWSGQIGCPGGRARIDESDLTTCQREVQEEIGWNLKCDTTFLLLGRMSDRDIDSFGNVKPLTVSIFVFLITTKTTPPFNLERKEVAAVLFTPLSTFTSSTLDITFLVHPLFLIYTSKWSGQRTIKLGFRVRRKSAATVAFMSYASPTQRKDELPSLSATGHYPASTTDTGMSMYWLWRWMSRFVRWPSLYDFECTHFPAISLPGEFLTSSGRTGVSLGDKLLYDTALQSVSSCTHFAVDTKQSAAHEQQVEERPSKEEMHEELHAELEHGFDVDEASFILWGFSLATVNDFCVQVLGHRVLNEALQRGSVSRQRALRFLHRTIDSVERGQKLWSKWLPSFPPHSSEVAYLPQVPRVQVTPTLSDVTTQHVPSLPSKL